MNSKYSSNTDLMMYKMVMIDGSRHRKIEDSKVFVDQMLLLMDEIESKTECKPFERPLFCLIVNGEVVASKDHRKRLNKIGIRHSVTKPISRRNMILCLQKATLL